MTKPTFWENYPTFLRDDGKPHYRPMYLYLIAKRHYYQGHPIMNDHTFDAFEGAIKKEFPDCPALKVVGEPTIEDVRELGDWIHSKHEEGINEQV